MRISNTEEGLREHEPFFGAWFLDDFIAAGSLGKVYRIKREELGVTYYSALKYIAVPNSPDEVQRLYGLGMSEQQIKGFYEEQVKQINEEALIMNMLKGYTNIVSYEDSRVFVKNGGLGYDVLLRMELLSDITKYTSQNRLSMADAIKLGIDICNALEICESKGIVHRDLKPTNIFINEYGDFKLGGFYAALRTNGNARAINKIDSMNIAPEVYAGGECTAASDIYALGITMYRLFNQGNGPYMYPAYSVTPAAVKRAFDHRMRGDRMCYPCYAIDELGDVILTACAYRPEYRFRNAAQMRMSLEAIYRKRKNDTRPLICNLSEPYEQDIDVGKNYLYSQQPAMQHMTSANIQFGEMNDEQYDGKDETVVVWKKQNNYSAPNNAFPMQQRNQEAASEVKAARDKLAEYFDRNS